MCPSDPGENDFRKLAELIKDIRVAMMQTHPAQAATFPPHVRPMYTQKLEPDVFEGELWFFTDADSAKVMDLERNPRILLTYASPEQNRFVVVAGAGACERNEAKAQELWNIHGKGWWPDGPRSPDLLLIRVLVHSAEYWEGPSSASYMLRLLKAVVTGERVKPMGEHGVVRP
jgi:general stress protein 26